MDEHSDGTIEGAMPEGDGTLRSLYSAYPLLDSLAFPTGATGGSGVAGRFSVSPLIPLLTAILGRTTDTQVCVRLPERDRVAALLACMVALERTRQSFPERFREHTASGFDIGQRVRVRPGGHVYEYGGYYSERIASIGADFGDLVRLKVLGRRENRSIPGKDLARLEATDDAAPKGKLNTRFPAASETALDRLLGVRTLGNHNLMGTEVLILTSRSEFSRFISDTKIASSGEGASIPLSDVVPWGHIRMDGAIEKEAESSAEGAPIIGVGATFATVAAAAHRADAGSRLVILDGAKPAANDLQILEEVQHRQRMMIISRFGEDEYTNHLEPQGWKVWQPPMRLFAPVSRSGGLTKRTRRAGACADLCQGIEIMPADYERLSEVGKLLNGAAAAMEEFDADELDRRILGRVYRALMEVTRLVEAPDADFISSLQRDLDVIRAELPERRRFWPEEVQRSIDAAIHLLEQEMEEECPCWTAKSSILENVLSGGARIPEIISHGKPDLERIASNQPDAVVLTGWPYRSVLEKLVLAFPAPRLMAIALPFEAAWFRRFNARLQSILRRGRISAQEAVELVGIDGLDRELEPDPVFELPGDAVLPLDDPLPAVERVGRAVSRSRSETGEMVDAIRIDFAGEAYAYLTASKRWPALTASTDNSHGPLRPAMKAASEIEVGEIVVFRSGGDSDVVRQLAIQLAGSEVYWQLHARANQWRTVLRKLGDNPAVVREILVPYGIRPVEQTVRNWLHDPAIIGPARKEDVLAITSALNDRVEEGSAPPDPDDTYDAVRAVRSLHIKAGHRISEVLSTELVNPDLGAIEGVTHMELSVGRVRLAEVRHIDREPIRVDSGSVNELFDDAW